MFGISHFRKWQDFKLLMSSSRCVWKLFSKLIFLPCINDLIYCGELMGACEVYCKDDELCGLSVSWASDSLLLPTPSLGWTTWGTDFFSLQSLQKTSVLLLLETLREEGWHCKERVGLGTFVSAASTSLVQAKPRQHQCWSGWPGPPGWQHLQYFIYPRVHPELRCSCCRWEECQMDTSGLNARFKRNIIWADRSKGFSWICGDWRYGFGVGFFSFCFLCKKASCSY